VSPAENAGGAPARKRVLSGMRPTGKLHIGHYFGALQNWVRLQNDPQYECFYFIADWHALTSDYADRTPIAQNSIEIATDYLAAGLDPAKSTIFLQSLVPEHAELFLLLSMVTPLRWLQHMATYKEALENIKTKDLSTYGFLGYPVLQSADIVMYSEPDRDLLVPVGEDQESHVEFSRKIVRRFYTLYCLKIDERLFIKPRKNLKVLLDHFGHEIEQDILDEWSTTAIEKLIEKIAEEVGIENFREHLRRLRLDEYFQFTDVLREPKVILTATPRIPGLDGRKMSKSYGNAIMLSESDADIRAKTKVMVTDPARKRRTDPGNPDICPVYDWHKLFSPPETQEWSANGCRTAGIGCIECKAAMADNLIKWIAPVRARREEYAAHPEKVLRVVDEGSTKALEVAKKTMARVRKAVLRWPHKRDEITGASRTSHNAKAGD